MIAPSLNAAIAVAYDALSAAERAPDRMTTLLHPRRAGMAVQALEADVARVQALEASPIPAHWRQQPVALADMPENVVPLRRARHIPIHCI
jgi:hypothetical protein